MLASTGTALLIDRGQAPFPLERVRDALVEPAFQLYLGRKSCPPSFPPQPSIVEVGSIAEAFRRYDEERARPTLPGARNTPDDAAAEIAADDGLQPDTLYDGLKEQRRERRRDRIEARDRWQFGRRDERIFRLGAKP